MKNIRLSMKAFNEINWHDTKLLSIDVRRVDGEDIVELLFDLNGDVSQPIYTRIIFHEVNYVYGDIYVAAKRVCADDLSGATCYDRSSWISQLESTHPYDTFHGYLHFEITLIPPGGILNVLATSFSMERALEDSVKAN